MNLSVEQKVLVTVGSDTYVGIVLAVSASGAKAWVCSTDENSIDALRAQYKPGDEKNAELYTRRDDGVYRRQGFKRGMCLCEYREGAAGLDPSF